MLTICKSLQSAAHTWDSANDVMNGAKYKTNVQNKTLGSFQSSSDYLKDLWFDSLITFTLITKLLCHICVQRQINVAVTGYY